MSDLARESLYQFRGKAYAYGENTLMQTERFATELSWRGYREAVLVRGHSETSQRIAAEVKERLSKSETEFDLIAELTGAAPGAPLEDVRRLAQNLRELSPQLIVAVGGSSVIDAVKGANVLATYGGAIEDYAGEDKVTSAAFETGKTLIQTLAIQTLAGAAAHLSRHICLETTPRANSSPSGYAPQVVITDIACVPMRAIFQYDVSKSAGYEVTVSGAFWGLQRLLKIATTSTKSPASEIIERIVPEGVRLILEGLQLVKDRDSIDSKNRAAHTALGYGTDLSGYAAMFEGYDSAKQGRQRGDG